MRCRACGGLILLPRPGNHPASGVVGGGGAGGGIPMAAPSGPASTESNESPFLNSEDTPPGGMPAIGARPGNRPAPPSRKPAAPARPPVDEDDGASLFGSADREEVAPAFNEAAASPIAAPAAGAGVSPIDLLPPRRPWQLLPYQYHLDTWGTRLAVILALAFAAAWMRAPEERETFPAWVWVTRYVASLALYILLIAPLTLLGLRRGMRMAVAPWPGNGVWRTYAAYLPAWSLGVSLWNVGGGSTPALICGLVLGMVLSAGAVWLWFRLHPEEIPLVVGFSSFGFIVGWLLALGILWSLNTAAETTASKSPTPPQYSPIGPAFKWDPKPAPAPKVQPTQNKKPATATAPATPTPPSTPTPTPAPTPAPAPTGPVNTPTTTAPVAGVPETPAAPAPLMNPNGETIDPKVAPVAPAEGTPEKPFITKREAVLLGEGFEEITRPIVPGPYFGVIRKTAETQRQLEAWGEGSRGGTASFTDVKALAVNPDGSQWARVTTFPSLSVETAPFDKPVPDHFDLQPALFGGKTPDVVGFLTKDKVLIRTDRGIGIVNWNDPKKPIVRFFNIPATLVVSPTAMIAISPLGDLAAIPVVDKNVQTLLIMNVERGIEQRRIKIEAVTAAPTGLTFSPDGLQIAAYYEERQGVLLRSFTVRTGVSTSNFTYPAPPVARKKAWAGSSLAWIPSGKMWLLYGDAFIRVRDGIPLGTLDLDNAAWAHIADDNVIEVVELNAAENRILRLTFNPDVLEGR